MWRLRYFYIDAFYSLAMLLAISAQVSPLLASSSLIIAKLNFTRKSVWLNFENIPEKFRLHSRTTICVF